MNKNTSSTRYYSDKHEKSICKALGGVQTSNSGATPFTKGDIILKEADLLIEAKCSMKPKESFTIKRDWIEKNKAEAFSMRKNNTSLCFNFEPEGSNYYIISEKMMKYLTDKLIEENS